MQKSANTNVAEWDTEETGRVGVMSIIDRDTDQVLSRFINVAEDAIGRHNIDEENVPPDRLIVEPGKAAFSPEERITIPEGMARDANGAADIASIEATIRYVETLNDEGEASGTWKIGEIMACLVRTTAVEHGLISTTTQIMALN